MDYEKLHKDTIAKLQEMVNSGKITVETACSICADFIPESEDEKMKKIISDILLIDSDEIREILDTNNVLMQDINDWLEKQCEKGTNGNEREIPNSEPPLTIKHAKEVMGIKQDDAWSEEDEMFVHGLIRGLAAKRDIHGHTTFSSDCIDITETIHWLELLKNRVLLYPVSVEYNEEDIDNIADTFIPEPVWNALEESEGEGSNAAAYDYSQMITMFKAGVHWLKSLKDRVQPQPKQEWSEEDEKCIRLSTDIIDSALRAGFCVQLDRDRCVDWLKSLRPQNTWKPSDEQIRELGIVATGKGWFSKEILSGLLEQLKKFRGE